MESFRFVRLYSTKFPLAFMTLSFIIRVEQLDLFSPQIEYV